MPSRFDPLYVYLRARFAERVPMTFAEIENLLGAPLPEAARSDAQWWSGTDPLAHQSPHADAWMMADFVALPNLQARTVVFERQDISAATRSRRRNIFRIR